MTDWVSWFHYQLQASADGLIWAFSQISPAFRENLPPEPEYFGTWPAVRHVWHVTEYERCLVIPSMNQWLDEPLPPKIPGQMMILLGRRCKTVGWKNSLVHFAIFGSNNWHCSTS